MHPSTPSRTQCAVLITPGPDINRMRPKTVRLSRGTRRTPVIAVIIFTQRAASEPRHATHTF
ncbi:hypothetical protein GCM10023159_19610 [Brevibacterium yomogidense]